MTSRRFRSLASGALAAICAGTIALALAGPASAARPRLPVPPGQTTPVVQNLPVTPEPGAALAFGLGVGVVAWAGRRRNRR